MTQNKKTTSTFSTEGIRYTGSKRSIVPRILEMIQEHCNDVDTVLGACAGTTRVSQALKMRGYSVTANDLAIYSKVFAQCYLQNTHGQEYYQPFIDELNSLDGVNGWFSQHYGGLVTSNPLGNAIQEDGQKRPWQRHNTQKLDAVLDRIPILTQDPIERAVLLSSTMLAMDKVDNTMGHQVAYLKKWSSRSFDSIQLQVPQLIPEGKPCFVSQRSIFEITEPYDLVYIDPPYGTNNQKVKTTRVRYRSYYHLWTTVCHNDQPSVHGAASRRYDASSDLLPGGVSTFENIKKPVVFSETKRMIEQLNCRYIMFSYSNKGKLTEEDLREIFKPYTVLEFAAFDHKENAMRHSTINDNWLGDQSRNQVSGV